jgi:ferric-dicitrate binding protein FerR (iron transport regulator)
MNEEKSPERQRLEKWTAENPRDELALTMFAAWVNCPVDKLPSEMRGHTCSATMKAWARVADEAIKFLGETP